MSKKAFLPPSKSRSAHCLSSSHPAALTAPTGAGRMLVAPVPSLLLQPKQAHSPCWVHPGESIQLVLGVCRDGGWSGHRSLGVSPNVPVKGGWSLSLPWLCCCPCAQALPGCVPAPAQLAASCFLAELVSSRAAPQPASLPGVLPSRSLCIAPRWTHKAPPAHSPSRSPHEQHTAISQTLLSLKTWWEAGLISSRTSNCLFDRTNKIAAILNRWFHTRNLIWMTDT